MRRSERRIGVAQVRESPSLQSARHGPNGRRGRLRRLVRNLWIAAFVAGAAAGAIVAVLISALSGDSASPVTTEAAEIERIERVVREILTAEAQNDRLTADTLVAEVLERVDPPLHDRVVMAYERVAPSIVLISAEGDEETRDDGLVYAPVALATGIVLDDRGNILTAAHVIENMESIEVILPDGERGHAELISSDAPFSDVAVLRVDADELIGLHPAVFGASNSLATGEPVLAVGNVLLGEEIAMTLGVVSRPDTEFPRDRYIQDDLIQTDAALNFGNSGGALVNLAGEVVGLTTVIARETRDGDFVDGVGFAIQIDPVLVIARAIAADGYYPRPTFGVVNERLLTPAAATQLGLSVTEGSFLLEIKRSGVFARAGIRPGDVIRELGQMTIDADTPFINALARLRPGVEVQVIVHRDGRDFGVTLAPELRLP